MKKLLEACGQSHVLKFWDELNEAQQKELLAQVKSIDFKAALQMWQKAHVDQEACKKVADNGLSPVEVQVKTPSLLRFVDLKNTCLLQD